MLLACNCESTWVQRVLFWDFSFWTSVAFVLRGRSCCLWCVSGIQCSQIRVYCDISLFSLESHLGVSGLATRDLDHIVGILWRALRANLDCTGRSNRQGWDNKKSYTFLLHEVNFVLFTKNERIGVVYIAYMWHAKSYLRQGFKDRELVTSSVLQVWLSKLQWIIKLIISPLTVYNALSTFKLLASLYAI